MKEKLIKIFKQNNGYLLSKHLESSSSLRYHLNNMLKNGEVVKVKQGLYTLAYFPKYDERVLLANLITEGVFCLFTAWEFYELTTSVSFQYHIALHRNTKTKLPDYPPVKLYNWEDKYYQLGIDTVIIDANKVRMYNKERSVCDAVKFRNKIGQDITNEVLKNYLKSEKRNLDLLMKYAKEMRIEKIIYPYIQALV